MGVLGKLASTTKQGFFSPVGWWLDTYQRRSEKIPCYSCASDKMDETKGEIEDLRRHSCLSESESSYCQDPDLDSGPAALKLTAYLYTGSNS